MADDTGRTGGSPAAPTDRLDSWKEIAAYLRRDESTVRRWLKHGLPVHRLPHKTKATIRAYKSELDAWFEHRGAAVETREPAMPTPWRSPAWRLAALVAGAGLLAVILGVRLYPPAAARRPLRPEAQKAYLRGRLLMNSRSDDAAARAKAHFEDAIAKDSGHAAAYASLAELYARGDLVGERPSSLNESRATARQLATKALELDSRLAEAHSALALADMADWNWAAAEHEFQTALHLDPNDATAHVWYAWHLGAVGRFDEALVHVTLAQTLEPASSYVNTKAAWVYFVARKYDRAIAECRELIGLEPGNSEARVVLTLAFLMQSKSEQVIRDLEPLVAAGKAGPWTLGTLAYAQARSGRTLEALSTVRSMEQRAHTGVISQQALAIAYVGLQDPQRAIDWLEEAHQERKWMFYVNVNPIFGPLHSDPRFQRIVHQMKFPESPGSGPAALESPARGLQPDDK